MWLFTHAGIKDNPKYGSDADTPSRSPIMSLSLNDALRDCRYSKADTMVITWDVETCVTRCSHLRPPELIINVLDKYMHTSRNRIFKTMLLALSINYNCICFIWQTLWFEASINAKNMAILKIHGICWSPTSQTMLCFVNTCNPSYFW